MKKIVIIVMLLLCAAGCRVDSGDGTFSDCETVTPDTITTGKPDNSDSAESYAFLRIVYYSPDYSPSPEDMDSLCAVIRARLDALGYGNATLHVLHEDTILVEFPTSNPKLPDPYDIMPILSKTAFLSFSDYEGYIILTCEQIVSAEADNLVDSLTGEIKPVVSVQLNPDAQQAFSEATAAAAAAPPGENTISIYLDEELLACPTVTEEVNSDTFVITVDTEQNAQELAMLINSGCLPFPIMAAEAYNSNDAFDENYLEVNEP